jgi:hypothetical protein
MNSDLESSRKKRKRSESSSSSSRSKSRDRSRSRSRDRKRSKKDKKEKRKRSRSKDKSKRKRSKSSKKGSRRKDRRERSKSSRSKSQSVSEEKFPGGKYPGMIPPMDPNMMGQYMYYPPVMPRDPRMVRPPMFYPPYPDPYARGPVRHPIPAVLPTPRPVEPVQQTLEQPPDKIVKDQNFLNSDEKLFESIVNNETHIRTIFEDTQISESYAGSTLYKTLRKLLHDPNTSIFESEKNGSNINTFTTFNIPKPNEIVQLEIQNYLKKTSPNKLSINLGDMSSIKEELMSIRNRKIQNQQINNNIAT